MASFGWKKKAPKLNSSVSYTPSKSQGTVNVFGDDIEENEDKIDSGKGEKGCERNIHYDWCVDLKNRKRNQASETISQQINRFKKEGIHMKMIEDEMPITKTVSAQLEDNKDAQFGESGGTLERNHDFRKLPISQVNSKVVFS